jgi:hypothetical protein
MPPWAQKSIPILPRLAGIFCRGGPPWPPFRRENIYCEERAATEGRPYNHADRTLLNVTYC